MQSSAMEAGAVQIWEGCCLFSKPITINEVLLSRVTVLIGLVSLGIKLNAASIAGIALWSLALYLGFSPVSEVVMEQLDRLFKAIASRISLDPQRQAEFAALLASLLSVIPFLMVGGLCNFGVEVSLGGSWSISTGILACIGGGVYELGRRDGQAAKNR